MSAMLSLKQSLGRLFGGEPETGMDALPVRVHGTEFTRTAASPVHVKGFDQPLVWVTFALLMFGLVMVYSASIAIPDNPRMGAGYSQTHFLLRHSLSLFVAFVAALLAFQIPLNTWERIAPWVFVVSIVLLIAVLIPFIGKSVNGARRWISLGFMNFQPSELAKLGVLMYAANYMVRKMDVKESFTRAVLPMAIALGVIGLLLLAEPDMGAFIVIALIAVGILFLGGVNGKVFTIMIATLLGALLSIIWLSPIRWERIKAFWKPWDEANAMGKAYQLTHSLIAFGRGEVTGQGLGQSVEKLHYLPEAHTDFLLAIIGEELGLIGVLAVILAFFWMVRRIFIIGRQAIALDRVFAGLVAQGVGIWMGFQAFINMGVNLGALPTKGLTLPLMSYGGSAILVNLIALAVVLRVDYENRQLMQGGRA